MKIDTGDATPIRSRPYPTSPAKRKVIDEEIDKMLLQGVIYKRPSAWAAPVVVVPKPDGTWRFCVSYVGLNGVTKKDAYPIHRADSLPSLLEGKCWFSAADLQSGFWQCPLSEEDQLKTGFVCHRGQYVFRVMPFGLCNAPSAFQRLMDHTFGDMLYKNAFIYIDDALITSVTLDDHLEHLEEMFERLKKNHLKIKLKKCHFFQDEIEYLGHLFGKDGVKPMDKNLDSLANFSTPQDTKGVRSFLGISGYYREHVPHYATLAQPLFRLLKKGIPFPQDRHGRNCLTPEQLTAFRRIKAHLLNRPLLRYPTVTLPFIVSCDTSDFATGAVLSQEYPVEKHSLLIDHDVDVPYPEQSRLEKGLYPPESLFGLKYQMVFQVRTAVYYSVLQYVLHQKAEFHELHALTLQLSQLQPKVAYRCEWYSTELARLEAELNQALEVSPEYEMEGWETVVDHEYYVGTLAKFYCQPQASDWLLRYQKAPKLDSKNPTEEDRLNNRSIAAVHSRLRAITASEPLPRVREIFWRQPVAFHSGTLSPAEAKYDARERELLGIIRAVEKFEPYIHKCTKLIIENDHKPLSYLYGCDHTGRLFRWAWRLQKFAPFTFVHRPGVLQQVPDGLSRYTSSMYEVKNLKEVLYDTEEDLQPPALEVLQALQEKLPPNLKRIYSPIASFDSIPDLWEKLGYQVLDTATINYFDQDQRPPPCDYDIIIGHGPYAHIGALMTNLAAQDKPWAVLIPTQFLTHPKSELWGITGLQIIAPVAWREFPRKSQRNVPLHFLWVTHGLGLPEDFTMVELPPLLEEDQSRTPAEINITRPLFEDPMVGTIDVANLRQGDPNPPVEVEEEDLPLEEPSIRHRAAYSTSRCKCFDRRAPGAPKPMCPLKHASSVLAVSAGKADGTPARRMTRSQTRVAQDPARPMTQDAPELLVPLKPFPPKPAPVAKDTAPRKNYSKNVPVNFEVEETLEHREKADGTLEYLVKWKGYSSDDNSWEPEAGLNQAAKSAMQGGFSWRPPGATPCRTQLLWQIQGCPTGTASRTLLTTARSYRCRPPCFKARFGSVKGKVQHDFAENSRHRNSGVLRQVSQHA